MIGTVSYPPRRPPVPIQSYPPLGSYPPLRPVRPPVGGSLWASLPLITFGLATPFTFMYAAARRRTAALVASATVYLGLMVAMWTMVAVADATWGAVVFFLAGLGLWLGGFTHALIVRRDVFTERPLYKDGNEAAVAAAERRRVVRGQARELADRDPALAVELCIGRPDLRRRYDDGGLIDVNHAPRQVLDRIPGMTPELSGAIVEAREHSGPFVSAEELSPVAQLPPTLTPQLVEYGVFLI